MIKLKDLLLETPSNRAMRDSKKGASKQFLRDYGIPVFLETVKISRKFIAAIENPKGAGNISFRKVSCVLGTQL